METSCFKQKPTLCYLSGTNQQKAEIVNELQVKKKKSWTSTPAKDSQDLEPELTDESLLNSKCQYVSTKVLDRWLTSPETLLLTYLSNIGIGVAASDNCLTNLNFSYRLSFFLSSQFVTFHVCRQLQHNECLQGHISSPCLQASPFGTAINTTAFRCGRTNYYFLSAIYLVLYYTIWLPPSS